MPRPDKPQSAIDRPDGIEALLADALYVDVGSLTLGAVITVGIAAVCWARSQSAVPLAIGLLVIAGTIVRVAITMQRRRRRLAWHHPVFASISVAYMFIVGLLTFWAFTVTDDPFLLTMTSAISIVNMMSVALRFFAVERVVVAHLIAVTIPVVAMFALRGNPRLS